MKKCLMIINARAGKQRIKGKLAEIISLFNQAGYRCQVEITQYSKHAGELAGKAEEFDLVVVAGGDGTLNEAINGMLQKGLKKPLGYLPCGTTNDFAASMGISRNLVRAAEDILNGQDQLIDVGKTKNHYFAYVASFGAFTESVYATPQNIKNALGYAAYLVEAAKSLADIHPIPLIVRTDGEELKESYLFGAVANGTSIAGFLKLDKKLVKMNDGLFELLLIRCPKDLKEITQIVGLINSRNYNNEFIRLIQAHQIEVISNKEINWNLDGEFVPGEKRMIFEVVPQAIQLRK